MWSDQSRLDTWSYVLWVYGRSVSLKPYRIKFAEGQDKFSQKNRITADLPSHKNARAPLKNHTLMLVMKKARTESKNSLACLTPDVLIVLLNILLKCQLACGEWQSDKTDADRGRNPSLTFIIPILPLKTFFHLRLMS